MAHAFTAFDWVVLLVYLLASVGIGASFYRKHRSSDDFFLAGRGMSWFPVAISILATDLSAISYMGIPSLVYQKDLKNFTSVFVLSVTMVVVTVLFVPIFFRLRVSTVYQYLEGRFGILARSFGSLLFLGGRTAWLANTIFVPALALSEITGLNVYTTILICGLVTTTYTILGGMKAVIWTDVLQFFVLMGGAIAILAVILNTFAWNVGDMWSIAGRGGNTQMFDFSLDPRRQFTFWGLLVGVFIYTLSAYSSDQIVAQRYFTTKSLKETARAVLGNGVIVIPVMAILYGGGIALVAYYATHPQLAATLSDPDRVLPHFAVHILPLGVRGLVLAGIFAATMSSVSAGINSVATAITKDFLTRFSLIGPQQELLAGRLLSLGWGLLASGCAVLLVTWRLNIIEKYASVYSYFAGPLAGMFLLGALTRRTREWNALVGALAGTGVALVVGLFTDVHWLWYGPVGFGVTFGSGYLLSLLSKNPDSDLTDYTFFGTIRLRAEERRLQGDLPIPSAASIRAEPKAKQTSLQAGK